MWFMYVTSVYQTEAAELGTTGSSPNSQTYHFSVIYGTSLNGNRLEIGPYPLRFRLAAPAPYKRLE